MYACIQLGGQRLSERRRAMFVCLVLVRGAVITSGVRAQLAVLMPLLLSAPAGVARSGANLAGGLILLTIIRVLGFVLELALWGAGNDRLPCSATQRVQWYKPV